MHVTNLKIVGVVMVTILFYTAVANVIPQVESDVPRAFAVTEDMTIEDVIVYGEELYRGVGACTACHDLGTRAPPLVTDYQGLGSIGVRCAVRVPGQSCRDYIHESLVDPNAYVVENYPPIMPDARRTLSETQILALVAFMEDQGGEVTVTVEEVMAAADAPAAAAPATAAAATPAAPAPAAAGAEPREILGNLCTICHELNGEGVAMGPALTGIGARLTADEIRRKILVPAADTAAGYEHLAGIMPPTFGDQLTGAQLEAIVAYLAELR